MIMDSGKYYLYRYTRLDKNVPFYIGVGTVSNVNCISDQDYYKRAFSMKGRSPYFLKLVNTITYKVEILLESTSRDFIFSKEIEFIKLYGRKDLRTGSLANLTIGGDGGNTGPKSKEEIARLILQNKRPVSEETRLKRSLKLIGRCHKPEDIIKAVKSRKEVCENRGYYRNRESMLKTCISINQYDLNMTPIKIWECLYDIPKKLKVTVQQIWKVCNSKRITAAGYIWKYNKGSEMEFIDPRSLEGNVKFANESGDSLTVINTVENQSKS